MSTSSCESKLLIVTPDIRNAPVPNNRKRKFSSNTTTCNFSYFLKIVRFFLYTYSVTEPERMCILHSPIVSFSSPLTASGSSVGNIFLWEDSGLSIPRRLTLPFQSGQPVNPAVWSKFPIYVALKRTEYVVLSFLQLFFNHRISILKRVLIPLSVITTARKVIRIPRRQ